MCKSEIIEIDEIIKLSFTDSQYMVYRVGSSVYETLDKIGDIDYLIVEDSLEVHNKLALFSFIENFYSDDITMFSLCTIKNNIRNSIQSQLEDLNFEVIFKFGPFKPVSNRTHIHIAGPLTIAELNIFFEYLPLFNMIFSKHNKLIKGKNFNEVFTCRYVSLVDFYSNARGLLNRITQSCSEETKVKVIKRIALLYFTFKDVENPYWLADKFEKHISLYSNVLEMNVDEIIKLANHYKTFGI